jgi:hypothetical protein
MSLPDRNEPSQTSHAEELRVLDMLLDEVWASVAGEVAAKGMDAEAARERLGCIVLALAQDGQLGPLQITRTAGRLFRETVA